MPTKSEQQLIAGNFDATPPNATELDLRADIPMPLKIRVSDIRDIFKRSGSYTPKNIILPGTRINNVFFGGLYDIGADFEIFNPNLKVECKLILDGEEVINGFLQLKEVKENDKGDVSYEITLYDQVSTILRNVKENFVTDIDFSDLDHTLNLTNISASWAGDWDTVGYFYPMLVDQEGLGFFNVEKWQMAIYDRLVLERVVAQAHPDFPDREFTLSGDLPDLDRFQREIIPYSGDKPRTSEATAASKACFVAVDADTTLIDDSSTPFGLILETIISPITFADESPAPLDDTNGLWSGTLFTAPVSGIYKFSVNMGFAASVDYTTIGSDDVESEIKMRVEVGLDVRDTGGTTINPIPGFSGLPYPMFSEPGDNTISTGDITSWFAVSLFLTSDGPHTVSTSPAQPNATGAFMGDEENGGIYMLAGWTARIQVKYQSAVHNFVGSTSLNLDLDIDRIRLFVLEDSTFRSEKIQSAYAGGDTIAVNGFIDPNLKQIDIINDLVARYNAFIYTNPDNENDIIFRTRDDFYGNGPTVDWTDKRDNSKRATIKMIGELQNAEFLFTYKKAGDEANKIYSDLRNQDIYGQFRFFFINEFVKGVKTITTPFEPTPFVRSGIVLGSNISAPIVPSINHINPNTGFRILHARKGLFNGDVSVNQDGSEPVTWLFIDKDPTTGLNTPTLFTGEYPFAGHYDHPIFPTFSLNFGNPSVVLAEMPSTASGSWLPPPETMFQAYWRNTMQQLSDGQMYIDDFDLTPADIAFVRKNPNVKVHIENQFFFVNQILFEANQNLRKLARVELITVEGQINIPLDVPEYQGSHEDDGVSPFFPPGTGDSSSLTSQADGNTEGPDLDNSSTRGSGNQIGGGSKNVTIVGDNNTVAPNLKNIELINANGNNIQADNVTIKNADNLIVSTPGVSIDGNVVTLEDGKSFLLYNKIDGGSNELRSAGATSEINKVDGGFNELRDIFGQYPLNKIDSDNGVTEEI